MYDKSSRSNRQSRSSSKGSSSSKRSQRQSPRPSVTASSEENVNQPLSLSSQGSSNLLERVSPFAPPGSTTAESLSSSNPTEADFNKLRQSIKDEIQQELKTEKSIKAVKLKLEENPDHQNLTSKIKADIKAKDWQKAIENMESVKPIVRDFIEIEKELKEEEQQEFLRKEEKNKQKKSGPKRASKISSDILKSNEFYLYRKMAREEADKILEKWGQTKGHKQQKALREVITDDNPRKWLTTTTEHSTTFSNENVDRGTSEVVIKITLDSQKYHKVLESRFPAYQSGSYDNKNKNKVLIHQERLAEGVIANTKNETELEKIFTENENYNAGFSYQNALQIDNAIKKVIIMD